MASNLTETPTFDANVQVPDDGDPEDAASVIAGFQPLANRTQYLVAATQYAAFGVDGTAVASGSKFTLNLIAESGGFSVSGDEITVPAPGAYVISVSTVNATSSGTAYALLALADAGTPFFQAAAYKQADGGSNNTVVHSFTALAVVGSPTSAHKISLQSQTTDLTALIFAANQTLIIQRVV